MNSSKLHFSLWGLLLVASPGVLFAHVDNRNVTHYITHHRSGVSVVASVVLMALLGWFVVTLVRVVEH